MQMSCSSRGVFALLLMGSAALVGCGGEGVETEAEAASESRGHRNNGRFLFERETFGGNGRTCATCHSRDSGTVSPQDAQRRFNRNPNDPLFRHDGLDDGVSGTTRILSRATIRIEIPLPMNVSIASDPSARSVVIARGIPTTLNTPALDPVLMYDGREPSLESQAAGAIHGHAQNTIEPTAEQLESIADFQRTERRFFSSSELFRFSRGGPAPTLPQGRTASERRGRRFFEDLPFVPNAAGTALSLDGICAHCHSGPMLNTGNQFGLFPPGSRFTTALVSELNRAGDPVETYIFTNPDGSTTEITSPDPGRALITGNPADANLFKAPTLRGLTKTAPYFHNNLAATLDEVVDQYAAFFGAVSIGGLPIEPITAQDRQDIIAFLRLLSE